jgi:homoserine kinase type II
MGIITKLSFAEIADHLQTEYRLRLISMEPSKDGVSDSVYLVATDKGAFALKLFETADIEQIKSEHSLLYSLGSLPVAQPYRHRHVPFLSGKPSSLYCAFSGLHETENVAAIGGFLSQMHRVSGALKSKNQSFATQFEKLEQTIANTPFGKYTGLVDEMLRLACDGVIHGDIFPDNTVFEGDVLVGVIDFIEAAEGSFAFDLGVAAFSFCAKDGIVQFDKLISILDAYKFRKYTQKELLRFASYAALFYGVGRFVGGRSYCGCLNFLQNYA